MAGVGGGGARGGAEGPPTMSFCASLSLPSGHLVKKPLLGVN